MWVFLGPGIPECLYVVGFVVEMACLFNGALASLVFGMLHLHGWPLDLFPRFCMLVDSH